MIFHTTFGCPCAWVLRLNQAYMSKTQVATEIIRLQAGIPKGGSLKIVCCQYVRLINSHTPTMKSLHDRETTSPSCIKPKIAKSG